MSSVEVPQNDSQVVLRGTINEAFSDEFVRVTETGSLSPPIGMRQVGSLQEHVTPKAVGLKAVLTWQSDDGQFSHDEEVGDKWRFSYSLNVRHRDGAAWDRRTPILHPAVAAVDSTQAGYDDAFMRAMANVDILVNVGRDDSKVGIRTMVQRYSKYTYSPFRLLVRGVVLWTICARNEMQGLPCTDWRNVDAPQPRHLRDVGAYSQLAIHQGVSGRDVAYVQCNSASQLYMVEVMRAICNSRCPVTTSMSVREVWPPMNSPYVAYSCPAGIDMGEGYFDTHRVEMTLKNFCDTFDCHDLLEEAMRAVQFFVCRPNDAGVLAGSTTVGWTTPASDMRVGAIGPLLAGVTAEGMKTIPFIFPEPAEYLYSAAVRGCFTTAAFYEALLRFDESHPVARIVRPTNRAGRYRHLTIPTSGISFMEKYVRPIATKAGWDCVTKSLLGVHLQDTHDFVNTVFRAARVPWWTNVILHMSGGGEAFLSTWTRPAQITAHPSSNKWYTYHTLGDVTRSQLAAAVRWMGAEVMYSADNVLGERGWHAMPTGDNSRFLPNLDPKVRVGGQVVAVACIKFTAHVNAKINFLKAIANSRLIVVKEPEVAIVPVAMDVIDQIMMDSPPLFSSVVIETDGPPQQPVVTPAPPAPEPEGQVPADTPPASEFGEDDKPEPVPKDTSVDWEKMARHVDKFELGMGSVAIGATVAGMPNSESPLCTAVERLSKINVESLINLAPFEDQEPIARAYVLLSSKLAIHAQNQDINKQLAGRQAGALTLLEALVERDRPITNWADATEAEKFSGKEVKKFKAAKAAGKEPISLARDDPPGKTETLLDFGPATSATGSVGPAPPASDVADPSQLESIGFEAPPPSAGLTK